MMAQLLDAISLAVYAFGALTFATLALFYLFERRRRGNTVFTVFTLVCAAAFVNNLLGGLWPVGLAVTLLPPLLFHLVTENAEAGRGWRWLRVAFYPASAAAGTALALGAATAMGLVYLALAPQPARAADRTLRHWMRALLALMLLCTALSRSQAGLYVAQVPDYLLLAFFGVSLYYRERLVFFDVLLRRGVFVAAGLAAVTAARSWHYGTGMLLWLASPVVYWLASRAIDRLWLRRPYSPAEAEKVFARAVQATVSEDDLRTRAAESLTAIFQAPVRLHFGEAAAVDEEGLSAGAITLGPRANGAPYLSGDRRLVQSLAAALGMERERQLRLLATRAELKALRAQINPHFLFNSLSVIAGLMQYQPELADQTIERLAQVFRYTLRKSENEWAPLGEEVEFITAYLGIEQARFGRRLDVELEVDPAASRIMIPAMSIQPLVENAIRHGISAKEGRGTVRLRASLADGRLAVEVSDDGPGFPPGFSLEQRGEGHGLRNVAERLRGYYGDAARLTCASDGGARVLMTLAAGESR
jgi:signal transduction histidine kinase